MFSSAHLQCMSLNTGLTLHAPSRMLMLMCPTLLQLHTRSVDMRVRSGGADTRVSSTCSFAERYMDAYGPWTPEQRRGWAIMHGANKGMPWEYAGVRRVSQLHFRV